MTGQLTRADFLEDLEVLLATPRLTAAPLDACLRGQVFDSLEAHPLRLRFVCEAVRCVRNRATSEANEP